MERAPGALPLKAQPEWPTEPGPYLFLLEATGPFERQLLKKWIEANRPADVPDGDVQIALLPQTRRSRRSRWRNDPRLEAFLTTTDDPLVIPLRVIWFPRERDGEHMVGWQDLIQPGDPRDPDPLRQYVIYRKSPQRCAIIAAGAHRAREVRDAWADPEGRAAQDGLSLGEFAGLASLMLLEEQERAVRGSRYKVPAFPRESLYESRAFARGVAKYAREENTSYERMAWRMRRYVNEIAATHSPYVIDLVVGGVRYLFEQAYVALHYDKEELDALYTMSQRYPIVFLPSHKTNFDHLVLMYVLHQNGLPPNHTAGGINMNFFPVGPFLRRSGVFFIRREFRDDEPYKFVLRSYIDYLLERRFPLEWFIEGGRSRSGKMRAPRYGMLAYVVESYQRGSSEDVILLPVSLAYDQIQEVGTYAAEQTGGAKERESLSWMIKVIKSLRIGYGTAHVRFGAPISLRTFLAENDVTAADLADTRRPAIPKLAFEIATRINEATPITPISLVTLALLSAGDRAHTLDQVMQTLEPYIDYVTIRSLPVTVKFSIDDREMVVRALHELSEHGVVVIHEAATDTLYEIGPEQHLAAAYYRNTIIHFFVNSAIVELALLKAEETNQADLVRVVIDEAFNLRDLLKFEFFFAERDEFEAQIRSELSLYEPAWKQRLADGDARTVLLATRPFEAPAVLGPFLEAYRVVGDIIERDAYQSTIDVDELEKEALALGKQYLLQGKLTSPESVTSVVFSSAVKLAVNRGLCVSSPDMVERRLAFAEELRTLVHRLDTLTAIDAATDAGVLELE